ncbi:H-type lectin domain-containing protein [Planktotalea sp.]|uniref:H-type lectin domain-containing protein n=1 Tax=Planktotalea sp. TaxID=2029877 RepID=UPI003D6B4F05
MKRIRSHLFGIDQGEHVMFSDYENDGKMWSGSGTRQRKKTIVFSEPFADTPSVQVSMSLLDLDKDTNVRADAQAKNVSTTGFDLIFRTWDDTRVARVRLSWIAMGALIDDEGWELY